MVAVDRRARLPRKQLAHSSHMKHERPDMLYGLLELDWDYT